jgi:DNA-binding MarR family transcriptional regulator
MTQRPLAARGPGPDYEALAAFRYALRRFLGFSAAAARASRLSPSQHQALLAIKGSPGKRIITVGKLAELLLLRHHSAVGLVDRLVRKKLVRRTDDPEDGRRVRVQLTLRGEALLERLSAAHSDELRRLGPELRLLLRKLGR